MRALLLERARADGRIAGAAVAGSAAADAEDRWSDIDLCFSVAGARSRPTARRLERLHRPQARRRDRLDLHSRGG